MDGQMIVAPEALATFLALVGLLTCDQTGLVKRWLQSDTGDNTKRSRALYRSGFSDAWSGGRGG